MASASPLRARSNRDGNVSCCLSSSTKRLFPGGCRQETIDSTFAINLGRSLVSALSELHQRDPLLCKVEIKPVLVMGEIALIEIMTFFLSLPFPYYSSLYST